MRATLASLLIAVALLAPRTSDADWPQARHDARRTAQATGTADIVEPVAYWRRYIGGSLSPAALVVTDVDGDSASEFLLLIGGSAVAKGRSDGVVWRSPNLGLVAFIGVVDLDGVPGDELVARSEDRVYVLDVRDGSVRWAQPAGEIGTIGGTRLGDVDGDGLPDAAYSSPNTNTRDGAFEVLFD
jgi:hypothetical protein